MTECPECGFEELEPRKTVENNEVIEGDGQYCPECEAEFGEDTVLDWDDIDFPVWIEWESYNDTWRMYDKFFRKTGLHEDVTVDLRDMKYTVFHVWFRVDEDGSVEGPYDSKRGELI